MSYTLKYTGAEIDDILDRAVEGGEIDDELALKAPLASPALTGTPTAPTPAEGDDSTKVATTAYADRAAKSAAEEVAAATYITDTASGSIASFSDGADGIPMRSVKAQIKPVQDLHGYENPWPAGGNYNLLPCESASQTVNGVAFTVNANGTITASRTATSSYWANFVLASALAMPAGNYKVYAGIASSDVMVTVRDGGASGAVLAQTSSNGAVATLSLAEGKTLYVSIDFRPSYSGTNIVVSPMIIAGTSTTEPFVPYSNECPISGWTGAEVARTGGNLIDYATIQQGAIVQPVNANRCCNVTAPVWIKAGTKITISRQSGTARIVAAVFSALPPTNSNVIYDSGWQQSFPVTLTIPKDGWLLYNWASASTTSAITPQDVIDCGFKVEFGTSATPPTPTNSNTYERVIITFGNEIFGGEHNFTTGELKDDWKSIDLGAYDWGKTGGNFFYWSNRLQDFYRSDVVISGRTFGIGLCDQYQFVQDIVDGHNSSINLYYDAGFGQTRVFIRDDAKANMTIAEFKAAVTGIKLFYKTTDVQTHMILPQQITSLLGQNNVWSNTGDTEVKYVADPKLYIAKMIGGGALTLGSASPLSVNRPVTISEEDLEQADEVSEAVEADAETVLLAESGEIEEGAQE